MDWLIVVIIGVVGLAILIWALRVGRGKEAQLSDAEAYLRGLTAKSRSSQVSAPQNLTSAQSTAAYTQAPAAQLPAHIQAQAQALVRAGQKIQAIKLIRQSTGWDLVTAKRFADNL